MSPFVNAAAVRVSLNTLYGYAVIIRDNCIDIVPHVSGTVQSHRLGLAPANEVPRGVINVLHPSPAGTRNLFMMPPPPDGFDDSNPLKF